MTKKKIDELPVELFSQLAVDPIILSKLRLLASSVIDQSIRTLREGDVDSRKEVSARVLPMIAKAMELDAKKREREEAEAKAEEKEAAKEKEIIDEYSEVKAAHDALMKTIKEMK